MNTTIDASDKRTSKKSRLPLLIVIVQVLVLGSLWVARPYLSSHMEVNKSELDKRLEEVEKRSQERKKREDAERQKKKLSKKDMAKLKKEVRKKSARKIRQKLGEMNHIRRELKEEKRQKLELYKEKNISDARDSAQKKLQDDIAQLQEQAKDIDRHSAAQEAHLLSKKTDALKISADKFAKHTSAQSDTLQIDNAHIDNLKESASSAENSAQRLQNIQAKGQRNPTTRKRVGKQRPTQKYRDDLVQINKDIDDIAQGAYKDDLDFHEVDSMIANPGMELNTDAILAMDLEELYDLAKKLEQEMNQDYAAIRAAELSAIRGGDLQENYQQIASNLPERKKFNDFNLEDIEKELETIGDVNDYRGELEHVAQEVHKMLQNTQNMQGQTKGFQRLSNKNTKNGKQSTQQALAQLQAQQAIGKAAQMQAGRSVIIDMSQQMRASYTMGNGSKQGDTAVNRNNKQDTSALIASTTITQKHININSHKIKAEAMPGRKFTDSSSRTGWLYIDTWYVIGPWKIGFKNGLVDWSKMHPPEYEIDLSKEYIGKNGKTLNWHFTQSNTLRITPPDEQSDSTYYAYTEVHFEKDQDMLLAIASDDAAKVWVNDILVWQDNGLSAWSLDEGFRKVAFKKGFNTILIRIANGPVVCQYSLLLCPPDFR